MKYHAYIEGTDALSSRGSLRNWGLLMKPPGQERSVALSDLLRQSIHSRLAGYENVNDAERLAAS